MADRKSARARGYTRRWERFRLNFLRKHPLCRMCADDGYTTAATVVDHIEPHRGDMTIFWRPGNHQALCATHHSSHKQSVEALQDKGWALDEKGWPHRQR